MAEANNTDNPALKVLKKNVQFLIRNILALQHRHTEWLSVGRPVPTVEIQLTWDKLKDLDSTLSLHSKELFLSSASDEEKHGIEQDLETATASLFSLQVNVGDHLRKRNEASKAAQDARTKSTPFKLEKLSVPKFDGKVEGWHNFEDLFESAVGKSPLLNDAEKIAYLKQALTGDASSIVSRFPSSNSSYEEAWKLVKKRYSNVREIVFAHMRKFFEMKAVSDSASGLRQLCDTVNECWRSLKNLKIPVQQWDLVFVFVALQKLEPESRKEWLLTQETTLPTLEDFLEFFEQRATALADSHTKATPKQKQEAKSAHAIQSSGPSTSAQTAVQSTSTSSSSIPPCVKCGQFHHLFMCADFKKLTVQDRGNLVKSKGRCFNCLRPNCTAAKCERDKCKECGGRHHTLLHKKKTEKSSAAAAADEVVNEILDKSSSHQSSVPKKPSLYPDLSQVSSGHCSPSEKGQTKVILMETVLVHVLDSHGNQQVCRVFLDSGSESHFVSEHCMDRLGIPRQKTCVDITGIAGVDAGTARGLATLNIFSRINSYSVEVKALVMKKVTGHPLPRHPVSFPMEHLQGLELADPDFHTPSEIDIMLGIPLILSMTRPGLRQGPVGMPGAKNTVFGWVVSGEAPGADNQSSNHSMTVSASHSRCTPTERCIDATLRKFWELEEPCSPSQPISKEDEECELWFQSSVRKVPDGSYSVGLPFVSSFSGLGSSRGVALRRLCSVEKSLARHEEINSFYHNQIKEYLDKGWMEEVPVTQLNNPSFYLPHHIVTKEESSTTKHRIVFDASAKSSNGFSLNNVLRTGPKLQVDLIPILLQFRTHVVAMSADIVKFYNGFHIHPQDADFQRLLYRASPADPVKDMRMLRVTFGVAPAPFLAIRCLHQLADDNCELFPLAQKVVKKEFLVDNLLSGASTVEEACRLQDELIQLMGIGKLELRKWTSNFPELVSSVPSKNQAKSLPREVGADGTVKTIGLLWNPSNDTFGIKLSPNPFTPVGDSKNRVEILSQPSSSSSAIPQFVTKRQVLSGIAKIFDPLGWLSPITIRPKVLMQQLWKAKLDWDDHLPSELFLQWKSFCSKLYLLKEFVVPRCVVLPGGTSSGFELHGFCDASVVAYSACVYLKVVSSDGFPHVNLLCAKTSVAPVQGETIPRLELCGAVLLCQVMSTVLSSISLPVSSINCWTDSTCVLDWLHTEKKLNVFEHNRVRKISTMLPMASWSHVKGEDNPADCASRGISVKSFLADSAWLHGPEWLATSSPVVSASVSSVNPAPDWFQETLGAYIRRCDSFLTLRRHLAWWIRFVRSRCNPKVPSRHGPLMVGELNVSLNYLVRCVQKEKFADELKWCARKEKIKNRVKSMTPFIDDNGILRVGGRIGHSFMTYDQKHPILLPSNHHFTTIVLRHLHETHCHPGPQLLLTLFRDKFWVSHGPRICGAIVRNCIPCHKANPKPMAQKMGQLPKVRVTPAHPFHNVGLDYAGAFAINATTGRNPRLLKGYACVFICLAVKAIHLEYVSDLTTAAFLAAFDRFVSTRGTPAVVICDGGRNFLGAKNDIDAMQSFLASAAHLDKVTKFWVDQEVDFLFNPPCAPHHGGIYEAAVKSMKVHLHRVTDDRRLSIEEFWTLLKRIEATLNSRPLTPMSSDANDFSVLTPGHFLIGRSLKAAPQENLEDHKVHQMTRWQFVQQMAQHFNRRWSSQYIQSLQKSPKWFQEEPNLGVGRLVLMNDSDSILGPQKWILGRIAAVFSGKDNNVRVCDVNIPVTDKKGVVHINVYRRPITRVSPLPLD